MAALDDLFTQIPVQDIANKLGADQRGVNNDIQTLIPALLGGLAQNAQGDNPLGSILGSVLGGGQGNAIGEILGGLLGGKR